MKRFYLLGALAIAVATALVMGNNNEVQALTTDQDAALTAAMQDIKSLPKYDEYAKLFEADAAKDEDKRKEAILAIDPQATVDDVTQLPEIARNLPHVYEYKYLYDLVRFYQSGNEDPAELLEAMQKAVEVCNLLFGVTRAKSLAAKAAAVAATVDAPAPASQTAAPVSKTAMPTASLANDDSLARATSEPVATATEPVVSTDNIATAPAELIATVADNTPADSTPLGTIFAHTATGVTGIAAAGATLVANRQSGYKGARRGRR